MSFITVSGGSEKQRTLVLECARYSLHRLLGMHKPKFGKHNLDLWNDAVIEIELVKNLFKKESCKGDCTWSDDRNNPVEFEVRVDSSMNLPSLLLGVTHEMVHVKQYITGEMVDTSLWNICIWQGKRINWDKMDYFDHPWEIEAYGREAGLLDNFCHYHGYTRTKWYWQDPDYL